LRFALLVALVIGAGFAGWTRAPFGGDEHYILANATSPQWRERLFVYNAEFPGRDGGAWYSGLGSYQRRYVRIPSSLLMSAEAALFGGRAFAWIAVSVALHALNCLLGFRLLRRWLGDPARAALVTCLVGLHPAMAIPVSWVACQGYLMAAFGALAAAGCLDAWQRSGARLALAGTSVFALWSISSYEVAIALPLLLLLFDAWRRARSRAGSAAPLAGSAWTLRAALLPLYAVYAGLVCWNFRDVTHSDASYRAPLGEFLLLTIGDFSNYLVKSVVGQPPGYEALYGWIGHPLVAALLLAAAAALLLRCARREETWLGVVLYLAFLAPPLLSRAGVSFTNLPSTRQLYLPLSGVAVVLGVLFARPLGRRGLALGGLACGLLAAWQWALAPGPELAELHRRAGRAVQAHLAGAPRDATLLVVGHSSCGYDVRFDAAGRSVYDLVPAGRSGELPRLARAGPRTLLVESAEGLPIPSFTPPPPGSGVRLPFERPRVLDSGEQRIAVGVVQMPGGAARDSAVHELRFVLDEPVDRYVILTVQGCHRVQRVGFGRSPSGPALPAHSR
jgi:hypothetical protein